MSGRLIPKDKDYPKLSKATSGYVENPYFEKSDLNRGYFCYDCIYFINGNDCAIVRKDGPDVNGEESGIIAPHGLCTLWIPDETKTN
ncbi:MAG: hypothetical protein E6L04_04995 [Thaumarchaeota archaeon]|nr:MAG: hypothetical protein E6L04_04995 [Nitrososphaerota archaeon]TLX89694.1 MAG: hypothetical protein E6K97_04665 [Nitrososphaerota archaeon]